MSVGVLAPDLSEGYFTRVMSGVVEELTAAHYFYFTACHDWKKELIEKYPRMLVERAVDGFLLLNTTADEFAVPVPVVAISAHIACRQRDQHRSRPRTGREAGAGALALAWPPTNCLHARPAGDSRFGVSLGGIARVWRKRLDLETRSGTGDPHRRCSLVNEGRVSIRWRPRSATSRCESLLEKTRDFTAVFCFNDIAAIGAIRALKDAGLGVPSDVSVVGFDDILSAAYTTPSLTTVRQPLEEMGRRGAKVLLERIADREKKFPSEIVMEHGAGGARVDGTG